MAIQNTNDFYQHSAIVNSVFDCRLSGVILSSFYPSITSSLGTNVDRCIIVETARIVLKWYLPRSINPDSNKQIFSESNCDYFLIDVVEHNALGVQKYP